jgi:hypothetical protein
MKPLSEQLAVLSVRAKKAEDDAAAAQTEQRAKIKQRADQLQADTAARVAQVTTAATAAKDSAVSQWHTMQEQVKANNDRIRAKINAMKAQDQKDSAEFTAELAEDNAAAAIAFAYDAIDYAEAAALDAVYARSTAEALP